MITLQLWKNIQVNEMALKNPLKQKAPFTRNALNFTESKTYFKN